MLNVYRDFAMKRSPSLSLLGLRQQQSVLPVKIPIIEAMMQNGWALQSGTSHFLGQNLQKHLMLRTKMIKASEFMFGQPLGVFPQG